MNTQILTLFVLMLSAQASIALAASSKIDPAKPGGPARDQTLGSAPPPSSGSTPPAAETKKEGRTERTQRITGLITTVTSLELVVSQPVRREKKEVRFALRPDTAKEGTLKPGAQVTVDYQVEGSKNVAKRVRVQPERVKRQR